MEFLSSPELAGQATALGQVLMIDLVLAGDNAVAVGLAASAPAFLDITPKEVEEFQRGTEAEGTAVETPAALAGPAESKADAVRGG